MVWPWACVWQWHAHARGNATRMRVATNRAGILLAIMRPGQLKISLTQILDFFLVYFCCCQVAVLDGGGWRERESGSATETFDRSSKPVVPNCLQPLSKTCWDGSNNCWDGTNKPLQYVHVWEFGIQQIKSPWCTSCRKTCRIFPQVYAIAQTLASWTFGPNGV